MFNKRLIASVIAVGLTIAPSAAMATQTFLIQNPSQWRLQDYVPGGGVTVYFSSSGCTNGLLQLPATATTDEVNRFWTLVLTAKTAGTQVGVYYDTTTCTISSFFAPP